jgi:dimethylhistidine N-methyltransferase
MPPETARETFDIPLHDLHPEPEDMQSEVVRGLAGNPKTLPCKYFYDDHGSKLFDRICELDEYYPTRTEVGILESSAAEIAERLGRESLLIELGSGSSTKTHVLLRALDRPAGYVPIDISRNHLQDAARRIARAFSKLPVWPVCADFNAELSLPEELEQSANRAIFFPGSTIGNFVREERISLLRRIKGLCHPSGGTLLLGIDLVKDVERLEAAYNDSLGVTAAFNHNLLRRINRELDADFALDQFEHHAFFDTQNERIEMHLVSAERQRVAIDGHTFEFGRGETICTEHSHKFRVDGFAKLAAEAGWTLEHHWTDDEDLFAILLLTTGRRA